MSKSQIPNWEDITKAQHELATRFADDVETAAAFVLAYLAESIREGKLTAELAAWIPAFNRYRANARPATSMPVLAVRMHPSMWRNLLTTFDQGAAKVRAHIARQQKTGKLRASEAVMWSADITQARRPIVDAFAAAVRTHPSWRHFAGDILPDEATEPTES